MPWNFCSITREATTVRSHALQLERALGQQGRPSATKNIYIFFRKSKKTYHTQCKYHQVQMRYWSHRKGKWGKERLQGRYKITAAAASICVSACAGQMLHFLFRVLFAHFLINGQPSMTSEFLRTLHFSCTEPGLPEPVKLAQEPTGENSKAWIKAGGENHPAPV